MFMPRQYAVFTVAAVALFAAVSAAPANDKITSLPGFGAPPTNQYSGFLNLPGTKKQLHYWFAESSSNPASDPVLLWLNGGPGCSSLDGFLYEHGPLLVNANGTGLVENPNSWATVANMLYLEAPAGVGFSYSPDKHDYTTGDNQTAYDNLAALETFFREFPEFANNEFYISGESYAGVYVPTLANAIFSTRDTNKINMKGFLVGNGCFDAQIQAASDIPYLYGHGVISARLRDRIAKECSDMLNPTNDCQKLLMEAERDASGLNIYSTYGDCYSQKEAPFGSYFDYETRWTSALGNIARSSPRPPHPAVAATMPMVGSKVPCIDSDGGFKYLNDPAVRKALHVDNSPLNWDICSSVLDYHSNFGRNESMIPIYKRLVGHYRVLVYSGDTDGCVNFMGSEQCVTAVGKSISNDWHAWHYDDEAGPQVAGWVTEYGPDFSFVTVHGAGHMVPQWRPVPALKMLKSFLNKKQLD